MSPRTCKNSYSTIYNTRPCRRVLYYFSSSVSRMAVACVLGTRYMNTLHDVATSAKMMLTTMFCVISVTTANDSHALPWDISLTRGCKVPSRWNLCASCTACLRSGRRTSHACKRLLELENAHSAIKMNTVVGNPGTQMPIMPSPVQSSPRTA